ncbi:MAG: helix-turn-helix transcriptional regulator [Rhizobiaceae bacterium]|nr:helix-turn-helix transcriptional regulator [Rhizobiaceae bacterium]
MSVRSLQRRLAEFEISFSSLVRRVRIHEACRLLKHSDSSLTVIGFCSGFSDSAHFSRDFRSSVGISPSQYRAII